MIVTEEEAKKVQCPLAACAGMVAVIIVKLTAQEYQGDLAKDFAIASMCQASGCMMWTVLHKRVSREDHSGGADIINKLASETGRIAHREGPHGSLGMWIVDEVGYCGLAGG